MARKGFIEYGDDVIYVGTRDNESTYEGPTARVDYDKDWLNITTDDYEGHAMLNIEALPHLRRALARVARELRAKAKAGS
jgi:hypothetical protein